MQRSIYKSSGGGARGRGCLRPKILRDVDFLFSKKSSEKGSALFGLSLWPSGEKQLEKQNIILITMSLWHHTVESAAEPSHTRKRQDRLFHDDYSYAAVAVCVKFLLQPPTMQVPCLACLPAPLITRPTQPPSLPVHHTTLLCASFVFRRRAPVAGFAGHASDRARAGTAGGGEPRPAEHRQAGEHVYRGCPRPFCYSTVVVKNKQKQKRVGFNSTFWFWFLRFTSRVRGARATSVLVAPHVL